MQAAVGVQATASFKLGSSLRKPQERQLVFFLSFFLNYKRNPWPPGAPGGEVDHRLGSLILLPQAAWPGTAEGGGRRLREAGLQTAGFEVQGRNTPPTRGTVLNIRSGCGSSSSYLSADI